MERATLALGLLLKAAAALADLRRCCAQRLDWFNHRRLLQPIGNIPPAKAEAAVYATPENKPIAPEAANQPAADQPPGISCAATMLGSGFGGNRCAAGGA